MADRFALALVIWWQAGSGLLSELGAIFQGAEVDGGRGPVMAFVAAVGTMIAYFAAVIINFGDFSRFVRTEGEMKNGNFWDLPVSMASMRKVTEIETGSGGVSDFQ